MVTAICIIQLDSRGLLFERLFHGCQVRLSVVADHEPAIKLSGQVVLPTKEIGGGRTSTPEPAVRYLHELSWIERMVASRVTNETMAAPTLDHDVLVDRLPRNVSPILLREVVAGRDDGCKVVQHLGVGQALTRKHSARGTLLRFDVLAAKKRRQHVGWQLHAIDLTHRRQAASEPASREAVSGRDTDGGRRATTTKATVTITAMSSPAMPAPSLLLPDYVDRDLRGRNRSSVLKPVCGVPILGPAHSGPIVRSDSISMVSDRSLKYVDGAWSVLMVVNRAEDGTASPRRPSAR